MCVCVRAFARVPKRACVCVCIVRTCACDCDLRRPRAPPSDHTATLTRAAPRRAVSIDVDDALYGNRGGEEEVDGVRAAIDSMRAMVDGVAVWLSALELRAAALADEAPEGEVRAQARARALARSRV